MSLWSIVDLQHIARKKEIKDFKMDTTSGQCTDPIAHNQITAIARWKQ